MRHTTILALMAYTAVVTAQTAINGNIGGKVFDSTGNPYIVDKEIDVPKGKTLTINEGCVLLFKPFSGMVISGSCLVNGTAEHPVIFTSLNDRIYNKASTQPANAFDWNGISVEKGSKQISFDNVNVRYSTYGIKSQNPGVTITHSLFRQNGQFHFTINDKIQDVREDQPFSNTSAAAGGNASSGKSAPSSHRVILRYSLLGVGGAGAILGTILSINASQKYSHWKDIENQTNPLPPPGEYDKRKNDFHSAFTGALITDIIAGLGLAGFGLTFVF
jgi:hypothetical protein